MAILRITESFENYKEFETNLEFSNNGITEKLYVVLYKRKADVAGLAKRIEKKPVVVFLLSDSKEVPKRKWTKEMKAKAKEYAQEFPVSDAGKKLTLGGKIFYSSFGIVILGLCLAVVYFIVFISPELHKNKTDFATLPKVGDKYYGSFSKSETPTTAYYSTHIWVKITAVNLTDSICTYQLSTKPGEYTFKTLEEEHTNFSAELLKGKFTFDKTSEKVKIKSADHNVRFEAGVVNNEYKNYKISNE